MRQIKLSSKIKMRMLLILMFGAIIAAVIFAYGFFQMRKDFFDQTKQFNNSLSQISQLMSNKNGRCPTK